MASQREYGILLPCGSRVVHGSASNVRPAFPPQTGIPGTLHLFSVGHAGDAGSGTPVFKGAQGYFPFETGMRMPRHVHMTAAEEAGGAKRRFVVEKVFTVSGVALVELAGKTYVVPPLTLVLIAHGVPHTWTPCPAGVDLGALGVTGRDGDGAGERVVSDGRFAAVFEYEDETTFFPTAETRRLSTPDDYIPAGPERLQEIRFPEMGVQEVLDRAFFIWGGNARRVDGETPQS